MSMLVLGLVVIAVQEAAAPPAVLSPPDDVPAAVVAAVETLCTADPQAADGRGDSRATAARLGFSDEGGLWVAQVEGGTVEVAPAHGDAHCLITGDLSYAQAREAAFAAVDWGVDRGLPWRVRDRHGPVDDWNGRWFRAFSRGDLHVRFEHDRGAQGELDPPDDSRSRLLIRWTPGA